MANEKKVKRSVKIIAVIVAVVMLLSLFYGSILMVMYAS